MENKRLKLPIGIQTLTTSILMISAYICMHSAAFAQEMNYTRKYCLDFSFPKLNIEEWRDISQNHISVGKWRDYKKNIDALKIEAMTLPNPEEMSKEHEAIGYLDFKYRARLEARVILHEKILLPNGKFKNGLITLTCKGENLKQADLIVTGYDEFENIVSIDTLNALSRNKTASWQTFKKGFPLENTVFLRLAVVTEGVDSTYHQFNYGFSYNAYGHIDSTCTQNFLMNKIEIFLDGTPIDKFPLDERFKPLSINPSDIVPLSFKNERFYTGIPELKTKRIIAIGESCHGSETMSKTVVQLIKYQVINNNCKLIVIEQTGEEMLLFNRFIQGDKAINLKNIFNPDTYVLLSITQLNDLCLWLKDYNATTDDKVWLLGMDYRWNVFERKIAIADYLLTINRDLKLDFINEICADLLDKENMSGQQNAEKNYNLWRMNNQYLYPYIDYREIELIDYYLSKLPTHSLNGSMGDKREILKRDSLMSENFSFFANLISYDNKSIVVNAHFGHTNYIDDFFTTFPSFGYYTKENFKDDYFNIGMFSERGECLTNVKTILSPPSDNSLEYYFSKIDTDFFYLPTSDIKEKYASVRLIGNTNIENQFHIVYLSPHGRMGGSIYIRESEATSFPTPSNPPVPFYEARMDKCIERLKELMK